jgi:hypothetical protein
MEQNHIAQDSALTPEAATDEPASHFNLARAHAEGGILAFATAAEEAAYWAGVADGMHSEGRVPPSWLGMPGFAPEPEPATLPAPAEPPPAPAPDTLDFEPVPLRFRRDGWTPERQREYVEALADTGVARQAAARVGMSETSVNRLRRRPEARSFDRSCDGAMRLGAKRLVSIAYERAIEGTIKRHYYHGEVRSEERVYDGRLLIALLAKLGPLAMPDEESAEVARNWEPWMQAVEQGLPEPAPEPEPEAEPVEAKQTRTRKTGRISPSTATRSGKTNSASGGPAFPRPTISAAGKSPSGARRIISARSARRSRKRPRPTRPRRMKPGWRANAPAATPFSAS